MKKQAFDDELEAHRKNLIDLMKSEELRHCNGSYFTDSKEAVQKTKNLINRVLKNKIPMHLVAKEVLFDSITYVHRSGDSLIENYLNDPNYKKAFHLLLEADLNIWLLAMSVQKDGSLKPAWNRPKNIVESIFPRSEHHKDTRISLRENTLQAALRPLDKMPVEEAKIALEAIVDRFNLTTQEVALARPGLMGLEDKNALANAIVLVNAEELIKEKCLIFADLEEDSASFIQKVESTLKTAKTIVEIKSKPAPEFFDLEILKKRVTVEQTERLRSLNIIQAECGTDTSILKLVIDSADWVKKDPQVLATVFKGRSFIHQALLKGNGAAIDWIEEVGANIWLASTQDRCENAVEWFGQLLAEQGGYLSLEDIHLPAVKKIQSQIPQWARIIAYGAHLNGESNPIEWALKKTDQAIEHLKDNKSSSGMHIPAQGRDLTKAYLQELRSHMERIVITELVKTHSSTVLGNPSSSTDTGSDPSKVVRRRL